MNYRFKLSLLAVLALLNFRIATAQNSFPASGDASVKNSNIKILDVNGKGFRFYQTDILRSAELTADLSAGKGVGTGNTLILGVNNGYGAIYNQRILFRTASTDRMVIENDGYVGIGTTTPNSLLHIMGNVHGGQIQLQQYSNTKRMGIRAINDTKGDRMLFYTDIDNSVFPLAIYSNGNVGIGTDSPGSFKLSVEGKIGAREINVTATNPFPDYVFHSNYSLRPLSEVESFVKENKHLPEIPSAAEVEKNGINLGEMDALLLKKIEELTLYVIELTNKIEKLENKQ